jgi:uncharacterized BrkB/YihY/UPF0761 family membrane protein
MDYVFRGIMQRVADIFMVDILLLGSVLSYRYLSPGKIRLRDVFIGTVIFLALLQGIRFGFIFYVRKFSKLNLLYGSLFSIICFIIKDYLYSAAYPYGACVIGVLERMGRAGSIPPTEKGEPVASTGGD